MIDDLSFVTIWTKAATVEEATSNVSAQSSTPVTVAQVVSRARRLYRQGVVLREFLTGPALLTE